MRKNKKIGVILAAVIICAAVCTFPNQGTLAFLVQKAEPVENTFEVAQVNCEVLENFENNTKTDVRVKNSESSDCAVYIRVKLLFNWRDNMGIDLVPKAAWEPANGVIIPANSDWVLGADGYYYYKNPVSVKGETTPLINAITLTSDTDGYFQSLEILPSCIQAEPAEAVVYAWGAGTGGSVESVDNSTKELNVTNQK